MKKDILVKPLIYPMPVIMIATYNEDGSPNLMNAAWGTAIDTDMIGICLSKHKTTENILRCGAAVIQLATSKTIKECDYVGLVSGDKVKDKFIKTKFSVTKSNKVDAPIINELPLALECKFLYLDEESGMHYFKILGLKVDEEVLDENGNIIVDKLDPILYLSLDHSYRKIGEEVAKAFKIGKELI